MALYESQKKSVAKAYGNNGCVTAASVVLAILDKVEGDIYPAEVEFLLDNVGYCSSSSGGNPVIQPTGNRDDPEVIELGKSNKFGLEVKNVGDVSGLYYIGVVLTDENGQKYEYEGNPEYAASVKAGTSRMLVAYCVVPDTLSGKIKVSYVVHRKTSTTPS